MDRLCPATKAVPFRPRLSVDIPVRALLRDGAAADETAKAIRASVHANWEGHEINTARFLAPPRPMYSIGGWAGSARSGPPRKLAALR